MMTRYFFSILVLVLSNYEYSVQMVLKNIRGLTVESSETICLKMTDITYTKGKIYLFILANVTCVVFHNTKLEIEQQEDAVLGKCKEICTYKSAHLF